jgi:hypothetical protein
MHWETKKFVWLASLRWSGREPGISARCSSIKVSFGLYTQTVQWLASLRWSGREPVISARCASIKVSLGLYTQTVQWLVGAKFTPISLDSHPCPEGLHQHLLSLGRTRMPLSDLPRYCAATVAQRSHFVSRSPYLLTWVKYICISSFPSGEYCD